MSDRKTQTMKTKLESQGGATIERCFKLVCLPVVLLAVVSTGHAATDRPLEDFLRQLHSISSIRMDAHALIHAGMGSFSTAGAGSYTYLEQGEMFRIACQTDEHLGVLGNIEYGYDGETSLVKTSPTGALGFNTSVDKEAPTAMPNPFFYPLAFLFDREQCLGCRMGIDQIVGAIENMTVENRGRGIYMIGSTEFPQVYKVSMKTKHGLRVPASISWESSAGMEVRVRFQDYEVVDGIVWPTAVDVRGKNRQQDARMRSRYLLTVLKFNELLEPEEFRLPPGGEPPYPTNATTPPWSEQPDR